MSVVKPFLKWVGGKTQLLDAVLAAFPRHIRGSYREPFVGGGSVLLGVLSERAAGRIRIDGRICASDVNAALVALYVAVQTRVEDLLGALGGLKADWDTAARAGAAEAPNRSPASREVALAGGAESYYYWLRAQYNAMSAADKCSVNGSAHFLFLNKTCFRGVYREGPRGFNVPFGHYANPSVYDAEHLRSVSRLLAGVEFRVASFEAALPPPAAAAAAAGDFVYLDPPYVPETATSFVGYTADGFGAAAHATLFRRIRELAASGTAAFVLSNADVPLVRAEFADDAAYEKTVLDARRAIHSRAPASRTRELLIRSL